MYILRAPIVLLACCLMGMSARPALAQSQPIADPTKPATETDPKVADKPPSPIDLTASYTVDTLADAAGGLQRGVGAADLLKLSLAYDGAVLGREGLTGLLSLEHTFGSTVTARHVGGFQSLTAAEAQPAAARLYEAWLQQELAGGAVAVKAGFIDLNSTFDVQETAALFLNASHGIGPDISDTGQNGPSIYPTTALAATGVWRPADAWTLQLGVFDGVAGDPAHRADFVAVKLHGALVIAQAERRIGDAARAEVGAWTYTDRYPVPGETLPDGTPRTAGGDDGAYALVEGRLLGRGDEGGGVSGWVRAGLANGRINTAASYLGGGLVYTGPMFGRDKDEAGVSMARAGFGPAARAQGRLAGRDVGGAETVIEATYRYVANDWLSLQPDTQYVVRPHGDARIANALVVGLRLSLTYSR